MVGGGGGGGDRDREAERGQGTILTCKHAVEGQFRHSDRKACAVCRRSRENIRLCYWCLLDH